MIEADNFRKWCSSCNDLLIKNIRTAYGQGQDDSFKKLSQKHPPILQNQREVVITKEFRISKIPPWS